MELARNVWRRSLFIYKSSIPTSMRNSSSNETTSTSISKDNGISNLQDTNPKNYLVCNALEATEELSSYIGLAREFAHDSTEQHPYTDKLRRIQMILFDLHYTIKKATCGEKSNFEDKHTQDLEEWITEYSKQLPPVEQYIIPGGGKACASLHVARAMCKKAELSIRPLINDGMLDKEAQNYLKRLTDFLLTTSRMAAKCDNRIENIYIPRGEVKKEGHK